MGMTSEPQRKAETPSKADVDALEKHLSSKMLKEFQYQWSDLQRNAKHDEHYAHQEGKQALEEMQDEYAKQERQLVHDFRKMILRAEREEASQEAQDPSMLLAALP